MVRARRPARRRPGSGPRLEHFVEFDRGPGGRPARFAGAREIVAAWRPDEARDALAALDAALAGGAWIAGYAAYELGYALEPKLAPLMPQDRIGPLLEFGVFEEPPAAPPARAPGGGLGPFAPDWDRAAYGAAFDRVAGFIEAGDIYQANLTFRLRGRWRGDPGAIAAALAAAQPVGRGALLRLPCATLMGAPRRQHRRELRADLRRLCRQEEADRQAQVAAEERRRTRTRNR